MDPVYVNNGSKPDNEFKINYDQNSHVYLEVLRDHWRQITNVYNKSLINDDDVEIVKNNFDQIIILLLNEINNNTNPNDAPILSYIVNQNMFEITYLWTLSYPEYLYELKLNQLKFYELFLHNLNDNKTSVLFYHQVHKPLFLLLNNCSKLKSTFFENLIINILNQLCVFIGKNVHLLNIFFDLKSITNNDNRQLNVEQGPAKFLIFSLLIPYIYQDGDFGHRARCALLLIMNLSKKNQHLAKYVVENTDFCPILATGLSGLYSELPQKLIETHVKFFKLNKNDVLRIKSLNQFIYSLEFCNNVIQVSHALIANHLLQYVYHGFLLSIIAPVLNQNSLDEAIATTMYFDLFLRTVTEPKLVKLLVKFILYTKIDETSVLDVLIGRINANNKLCVVTLNLFYTIIDLNSEDAMYKLVLKYLLPCMSMRKSQFKLLDDRFEAHDKNAKYFLSLSTVYSWRSKNILSLMKNPQGQNDRDANFKDLTDAEVDWIRTINGNRSRPELEVLVNNVDNLRFNFVDYLKDAKAGIYDCKRKCNTWTCQYNGSSSQFQYESLLKQNINVDTDEYLLNLFTDEASDDDDGPLLPIEVNGKHNESNSNVEQSANSYFMDDSLLAKHDERRPIKPRKENNFYVLSFDNISSSSSDSSLRSSRTSLNELNDDDDDVQMASIEQMRDTVLNLFFSSKDSTDHYLNTNIMNFLTGLDKLDFVIPNDDNDDLEAFFDARLKSLLDSSRNQIQSPVNGTHYHHQPQTNDDDDGGVEIQRENCVVNIGPFLRALFTCLDNMLTNTLELNFLLTGLITRMCYYSQALMRSFLLDCNLFLQTNVKSLVHTLVAIRTQIDKSTEELDNFTLVYLQAELSLVKSLIDYKRPPSDKIESPSDVRVQPKVQSSGNPKTQKKFSEKILGFFRRSSISTDVEQVSTPSRKSSHQQDPGNDPFQQIQILDDLKMKFFNTNGEQSNLRPVDVIQMDTFNTKHVWDDLKTRNIAYSSVLFDEFLKELAGICEEHNTQQ